MPGLTASIAAGLVALGAGAGLFAAGRATADDGPASRAGEAAGYVRGVQDGRAAGVQEGRALQVPTAARAAFRAGYAAGAEDVFGGYDGGWSLGSPYAVTLFDPPGPRAYAIAERTLLRAGVTYRLCGRRLCSSDGG